MMQSADFELYRDILLKNSGIFLTPEKEYLLTTRVTPLCKTLGFSTLEEYTNHIRKTMNPDAINMVVEAMTTNETSFFRDIKPFNFLRERAFPYLLRERANQKKIRIWSAACSTGQEAYSMAMILQDMSEKFSGWSIEIFGTDIASHVVKKATAGEYNNFEIQRGLSMPVILKNFEQRDNMWYIKDHLKKGIRFQKFNLLQNPSHLGKFDIIFCRNVLIYFNPETKSTVLKNLQSCLASDGVLALGSSENIMGLKTELSPIPDAHGFYSQKPLAL
jgi:chemotaxis protein methyltransferase CheR